MKIENIKALAEIVSAHGLTSLEYDDGSSDVKIKLKKEIPVAAPQAPAIMPAVQAIAPAVPAAPAPPPETAAVPDFNHLKEVKCPLVGVFYSASSPDAESFVSLGSKVKKGDVLCIIEAMKLMNEITAEEDGEIVDICIKNGDVAEFGQVLFKLS